MPCIARFVFLAYCLLLVQEVASAAAQTATATASTLTPAAIDAAVETYIKRNGVPGAVVAVTDGNAVVVAKGYGHDSDGKRLTAASVMPIASLSKSFTAVVVMRLVEDGRIELDQPVVRYLPEFSVADSRSLTITVRQLMEHRSGLADSTFREKSIEPVPQTLQQAVAAMRTARLGSEPGARRSYHNPNYWVLARMVEVVTGKPYATNLREHVLQRLGMGLSATADAIPGDVASGHIRVLNHAFSAREPAWFLGGCCGLVTTAGDLGRWLIFQNGSGDGLVSASSMDAMHKGMGWTTFAGEKGTRLVAHDGILFTFTAQQYLLPDVGHGIGIAVITNTGIGAAPLDATNIADMLVSLALGEQADQPFRIGLGADIVLVLLILATVGCAVRRVRKPRARTISVIRMSVRVVVCAAVLAAVSFYPATLRTLSARDLNWQQSLFISPLLFLFVVTFAVAMLLTTAVAVRTRANALR